MFGTGIRAGVILLMAAASAWTQAGTPVTGTVRDEFGAAVAGCPVALTGGGSDTTDALGRYSVARPATGLSFGGRGLGGSGIETWLWFDVSGRRASARDATRARGGWIPAGRGFGSAGAESSGAAGSYGAAAKVAAAADSVRAACPDFLEKRVGVPAGTAPLDIAVARHWDIVIYGGTSAAVIAAVQALKMGKTAVMVSPDKRLGGLSSGGLGETDIGNKAAIGGLSREFYRRIAKQYLPDSAWTRQTKASYSRYSPDEMWTFEPKVALAVFHDFMAEARVPILYERLDLARAVVMDGARIVSLRTEAGRAVTGKMFIDATYEGDLMAKAGVKYHVGREANSVYGETYNGIQAARATKNQLVAGISAYVKAGDPSSGLLAGVNAGPGGADGSGDKRVQAYNFRVTLTNSPENRVAFAKPEGYDEGLYEILFRQIEAGYTGDFYKFSAMPNRKTDSNNQGGISTDFIGMNYDYPDGDYAVRARIIKAHEVYTRGLLWTLAYHPRVPQAIRDKHAAWGYPKDEFADNGNFSPQIYVRESRRMLGSMVMSQKHVTRAAPVANSVGMGAYTMDSHNVQRHVNASGHVVNEGDVQQGGFGPYPIDMGAILPKAAEASNLVVPVCLSASHIAYGSIRMEPVFMVLGQSAATLAAQALDQKVAVQGVNPATLKARLLADGQVLDTGTPGP